MCRAARVLVAGAGAAWFKPCSGLRCGLRLSAGSRKLPARGAWELPEDSERGVLARSVPLWVLSPLLSHSPGLGCWDPSAGHRSAAGLLLASRWIFFFFFLSGAPSSTFIFALLQAECACQSQTQTGSFISQVKTGTILATEDNPKSQHVACAARRPSTPSLQPTPSRLGEGRGQPPSSSRLESEAAAPSLARAAQLLLRGRRPRPLSWLRERGGRGRDLLFFPRSPKDRTPDFFFFFCFLIRLFWNIWRRRLF